MILHHAPQPFANQPCAPNNRTKINPEITGDTENGRSINVVNRLLPLNSKRVIAQAAATPNTVFNGTVTNAVNKVSLIADSVSASDNAASSPYALEKPEK
jgi:hypothetical protein